MKNKESVSSVLAYDIVEGVKKLISKSKFDVTVKGRVTSVEDDGTYTVKYDGKTLSGLKSHNTHSVDDIVFIKFPSNNTEFAYIDF